MEGTATRWRERRIRFLEAGFFVLLNSHVRSPENYTLKVAGLVWQGF